MSYALSSALQAAVFQKLIADIAVTDLVGTAIFDALPAGNVPPLYVAIGPERVKDASDQTGGGALHEFVISVVTDHAGFAGAKTVSGLISDSLIDAPLNLSRGKLVSLRFFKAAAARVGTGDQRRIDLTFRARVCDG